MSTLDTPMAQGGHGELRAADAQSIWALRWHRFRGHRTGVASLVVLALLVVFCLMAGPLEAWRGIDATQTDLFKRYQAEFKAQIDELNPWLTQPDAVTIAPDGDAEVNDVDSFVIPDCSVCGGELKPDVVFFGEFVPPLRFEAARELVDGAGALLVAGSSLAVNSGIRLVEHARRRRLPIVVVNRGETKGDARATLKLDAGTSETLVAMAAALIR